MTRARRGGDSPHPGRRDPFLSRLALATLVDYSDPASFPFGSESGGPKQGFWLSPALNPVLARAKQ
jgi:hypothetical protein